MNTQAQEQFVEDFLLVSENDYDTFMDYTSLIKIKGVAKTAEIIQEQFENWVSELAEEQEGKKNAYGALLLRQLLIGWGSDSFFKIAQRFNQE